MVDAFATFLDLADRLNRTFTTEEEAWITVLLEDASTYLRDVIGQQVYPQAQSTFKAWPEGSGVIVLPAFPVVSVDAVKVAGVAVDYTWRDDRIEVCTSEQVDVTFTYGFAAAPEGLKRWACVLVSQTLFPLEQGLGLTVGGLSSLAIDDFRLAFANAGEQTGMSLSDRNQAQIRAQYSPAGAFVTDVRP